jgi:tetratricopeptide (TPR) repeat protein
MKKFKEIILGILVIAALVATITFVYRHEKSKVNRELAKRIAELSPRGGPPETIEGLRQAIALYEAQIERNVQEGAQTGTYWKILAIRLADRGMHRDSLAALERAIYFNAGDPTIYYLTGVSAGITAKSIVGFNSGAAAEREHFFKLSENSYKRALELDSQYNKPMYGLGVLYTFELDRPLEAIPHLERYLQLLPNDISAMFVLARAYFMTENFQPAIDLYDRIISRTKDARVRAEAQNNREIVAERMYG